MGSWHFNRWGALGEFVWPLLLLLPQTAKYTDYRGRDLLSGRYHRMLEAGGGMVTPSDCHQEGEGGGGGGGGVW